MPSSGRQRLGLGPGKKPRARAHRGLVSEQLTRFVALVLREVVELADDGHHSLEGRRRRVTANCASAVMRCAGVRPSAPTASTKSIHAMLPGLPTARWPVAGQLRRGC